MAGLDAEGAGEPLVAGVLERRAYDESRRRHDYVLTDKGRALWPVITTLREWGDEWITGAGNEPLVIEHLSCGSIARTRLVCDCCGEPLRPGQVRARPGPGRGADTLIVDGPPRPR